MGTPHNHWGFWPAFRTAGAHVHGGGGDRSTVRLIAAIVVNILLTAAQVAGGVLSGSLALIADALHNFSDATALVVALVARRIALRKPDHRRTFGYGRAQIIGAMINLTSLILIAVYLLVEAAQRFFVREPIAGWTVVIVAALALLIDVITAAMVYSLARGSLNIKAVFLHNLTDALASVGVILAGLLIVFFDLYVADLVATVAIAGYILHQSFPVLKQAVTILMESVPDDVDLSELIAAVREVPGVHSIHHVHAWHLDENRKAMEAHIVIDPLNAHDMERTKEAIKQRLVQDFDITHSTLEFEFINPESKDQT
ncbi:MAG: cation transporter [Phycisphaerae bacterium]|nr:cation transporter [Phycisphaerae bacterium]